MLYISISVTLTFRSFSGTPQSSMLFSSALRCNTHHVCNGSMATLGGVKSGTIRRHSCTNVLFCCASYSWNKKLQLMQALASCLFSLIRRWSAQLSSIWLWPEWSNVGEPFCRLLRIYRVSVNRVSVLRELFSWNQTDECNLGIIFCRGLSLVCTLFQYFRGSLFELLVP